MAEKIATRAAYGKALVEFADQEPNLVVLDADLSGSTMTKDFGTAHPDRFFDMGIAEANMVGVAAGLATCGKKPFVNSFAMFAAGRAWEQVRNSVAYPGLNVKVVGSSRLCWPMTALPTCGWAAWRWRPSPIKSLITALKSGKAYSCGRAATSQWWPWA